MESRALDIPGVFRLGETRRKPDQSFPLNLGREGVHEICEARHGDMAAMTGFALAAARPPAGAVFWVRQFGLAREHGDLWASEEAISSGAVGLVIAEIETLDFTASRRLTLAASRHGIPLILLLPWRREGTSAATARWRVASRPSGPNAFDARAPGASRWQAVLEKSRQAPQMAGRVFNIELDHETLSLRVVSGLAAHAPAPRAASADIGLSQNPPRRKTG